MQDFYTAKKKKKKRQQIFIQCNVRDKNGAHEIYKRWLKEMCNSKSQPTCEYFPVFLCLVDRAEVPTDLIMVCLNLLLLLQLILVMANHVIQLLQLILRELDPLRDLDRLWSVVLMGLGK